MTRHLFEPLRLWALVFVSAVAIGFSMGYFDHG